MGLKDYRPKNTGTSNLLGSGAAEIVEYKKEDGVVTIQATAAVDCLGVEQGTPLTIRFDPDSAERCEEFLKNGFGSGPGSIIVLENCRKGKDGEIISNWVTTAVSAAKKTDPNSPHAKADVERAYISTPMISFNNPNRAKGEPQRISFGLTSPTARMRTDAGYKTFDRQFLRNKLSQVSGEDLKKAVRISAIVTNPSGAVKMNSIQEALDFLREHLATNNALAMVRIMDDENEIEMAYIRKDYQKELEDQLKDLETMNLVNSVPNEVLAEKLGEWTLEVIPAFEVPFLGKSIERIVKLVAEKDTPDLTSFNITFGENGAGRVTDCLLVTSLTAGGDPYFFHEPVAIDRRNRYALRYLPTENINVPEPKREAPAAAGTGAQPAGDQQPEGAPAAAGGENFDPAEFEVTNMTGDEIPGAETAAPSAGTANQRRNG